jgi:serine/threonine protein kinase
MSLSLSPEDATFVWDELAQRLERFIATWERGEEPTLADYLPPEPPALRRLVLIELVKVDLEHRIARQCRLELSRYSELHPELVDNGEPPFELIYEEYHLRRSAGEPVTLSQYCQRFPGNAATLKRLAGTEDVTCSTQMTGARRIEGIAPGQKLDEFELLVELGKGAFGSVYLARQTSMQRLVALKISADKGTEHQTLAQLDHPNIVRVYDQRRLDDRKMRLLYMQYAPGGTLAEVVKKVRESPPAARSGTILVKCVGEALEKAGALVIEDSATKKRMAAATWPETVCRLGIQMAQALDYAHHQGILHRDVKPANVLLAGDCSPKLADFNISFCSQLDGASPAAYFGGSLAYMSPEQLEACNPKHPRDASELDGRSDLYSLAVVLWELLYGDRPFVDEQLPAGWSATLEDMTARRRDPLLPAPDKSQDGLSHCIHQVLCRTLSPNMNERHKDGMEMARDLMLCLNPSAHDLLKGLRFGWRELVRQHPFIALLPINLLPVMAAAVFHFWYNYNNIIHPDHASKLISPQESSFWTIQWFVNGISFPLATYIVARYSWSMFRVLGRMKRGQEVPIDELLSARRRSLGIAYCIVLTGLGMWIAAGLTFPIGIDLMTRLHLVAIPRNVNPGFPPSGYIHFMLSSLVCGMISCGIPFLGTTRVAVRVYYPSLLGTTAPETSELRQLAALSRHCGYSLFSAAVVPMLAMFLLALAAKDQMASLVLIVASVFGFLASYFMYGRILGDLRALNIATRPVESFDVMSDTVDRF